jgi:hypothetical protein
MNYSELKKELKKEFESFLKPIGYKSKTGNQGCKFSLINDYSQFIIGYGVSNYIDEFYTGCYIQIEIQAIEKIRELLFNDDGGYAIGSNIDTYFDELNYRYKIKTEEDIKEWGKILRKFYQEYAVPFFEKYNSIAAIDKLLNDTPTEKVIYCDDLGWRIIKGLIAAKLNSNPKYKELRDYYKSEVQSKFKGHFMYEKCMKVINYLDGHSSEELNIIANG